MICDLKKAARGFRGTWMKEYLGEGGVGVGWRLQSGPVTHGAGQAARAPSDRAVPQEFLSLAQPGRCDCSWNKILACLRRAELKVHYVLLLETLFFL